MWLSTAGTPADGYLAPLLGNKPTFYYLISNGCCVSRPLSASKVLLLASTRKLRPLLIVEVTQLKIHHQLHWYYLNSKPKIQYKQNYEACCSLTKPAFSQVYQRWSTYFLIGRFTKPDLIT